MRLRQEHEINLLTTSNPRNLHKNWQRSAIKEVFFVGFDSHTLLNMVQFNFRHLPLVTAAVLLLLLPSAAPDIASDRAALIALRSAVRGRPLLWNLSSPTCSWAGVSCSPDNSSVVELRLPGMGLSGELPPNTILRLTALQALSLRYNSLSGPLPADLFSSLTTLRYLYLQHNFFSGEIPDSLFSLTSLVRLNLAHNNFSGGLSPSFNNLTRLGTLYLQGNDFSGPIPDLNLPGLDQFDVSNNNLSGRIPKGLSGKPVSSFDGNSLCGAPLNPCGDEGTKKKLSGGEIAGIIIGSVLGGILILLLVFCLCRRLTRSKSETGSNKEVENPRGGVRGGMSEGTSSSFASTVGAKEKQKSEGNGIGGGKKELTFFGKMGWNFDMEDLLRASAEVLGKGTFGTSYKAVLEAELTLAVKRLRDVKLGEKDFRKRMEEIGRIDHHNLVPLRAYYYNADEKLLVYDYLPMGSLSALLHGDKGGNRTPLSWETRANIALGAARGISHLHSQDSSFSHGNIKSSNVLLTKSYEARVSDFRLAPLAGPSPAPNRGTVYRAPEVTDPHKVSQKADVYSFGVLLLELLTGKAPMHSLSTNEEGVDLPRWVHSVVREEWASQVFDDELVRYPTVDDHMVKLLQISLDCTEQHPDKRPSMAEVSSRIEELCLDLNRDHSGEIVNLVEE